MIGGIHLVVIVCDLLSMEGEFGGDGGVIT